MSVSVREQAFGQGYRLTPVDRLGVWLSARQVRRWVKDFRGLSVLDAGCGFEARLARTWVEEAKQTILLDVALSTQLQGHEKVQCVLGALPQSLEQVPSSSVDVLLCLSVLEHLWEPEGALRHFFRILKPQGVALLNVPSWRGKSFLEFSAFRLGWSPKSEMDDHKAYYDPKDLWPLLVRAGFLPSQIKCFRHKFGLNTFAVCKKETAA